MPHIIEAVYENGVFRPVEKIDLPSGERVKLIVKAVGVKKEEYLKKLGITKNEISEFELEREIENVMKAREMEKERVG